MNEEEYLKDRLEQQISWYGNKSRVNQEWYKKLRLAEIAAAAFIPFLSGMQAKAPWFPWIIGSLGVLIAVAGAASTLFKFHENWIQYRATAEQLKHEKFMYLTRTNLYHANDRFALLVERVENLISKENTAWAQVTKKQDQPESKG